ncbi:MAG: AMP-binding protein [Corynebacterium sp.]|nr:AMP-binding protein [Corynebacterium sp.]
MNPPKGGAVFEQLSYDLKGALRGSKAFLDTGFLKGSTPAGGLGVAKALGRYGTSLAGLLEGTAARFPDRLVLVDDQGELTYQELANRARLTAHTLASHGIGPNSRVGIMARNGRGFFIPLAAKGYLGYTVFLLNVGASKNQLADIVKEHKLDVIFVDSEFDDRFPEDLSDFGCTLIHADAAEGYRTDFDYPTMEEFWTSPGPHNDAFPSRPKQGGVVLMSSGTSGTPKAVSHTEPSFPVGVLGPALEGLGVKAGDRLQLTASLFHVLGWGASVLAIVAGCTLVTQREFKPKNVLKQFVVYKCTGTISSAVFLKDVLAADDGSYDTSSMTWIMNAGNAMSEDLVVGLQERYGNIVSSGYGSTEGLLVAFANPEDLAADPLTAGYPVWNGRLEVLDPETGKEVPAGQVGIIHAINALSMKGYLGDRDKAEYRNGMIDLGDKGIVDPESGRLRVLGRNNDMVIVGGENIWPTSVAEIIDRLDGVAESYCVGVEDDEKFQRVKAYVVVEDGATVTEDDVREQVEHNFMKPAIPRDVVIMSAPLPRNAIGKVVKRELEAFG